MTPSRIRRASVCKVNAVEAAADLYASLWQPDCSLVLLFVSPDYDLEALAPALERYFQGVTIVGCTTAGEIAVNGYHSHSISGVSLAAPDFYAVTQRIESLEHFDLSDALGVVMSARHALGVQSGLMIDRRAFAMLLIDGMAACEERVTSQLSRALGEVPLFGGSAGDNMRFEKTAVLIDGQFRSHCAALILIATKYPFEVFKSEHTARTGERVVITEADSNQRLVTEINAEPAAAEYARLLGVSVESLSPRIFATHPLVLQVSGVPYVRSIQRVNPDLSLNFFCAIDEGLVLSGTRTLDIVDNLAQTFSRLRHRLGPLQLVFGFDCFLRTLPLHDPDAIARLSNLLAAHNVVGFNTYGEQFNAMHVNQTFTGIAIGMGSDE